MITFISNTFNPATNSQSNLVTPSYTILNADLPSAQVGDLIVLKLMSQNASPILTASGGGQTWNNSQPTVYTSTNMRMRVVWCRFNGTWTGNVTIQNHATNSLHAGYAFYVFRPSDPSNLWAVEDPLSTTASATSGTLTIPAETPVNISTLSLAFWYGQCGATGSYGVLSNANFINAGGPSGAAYQHVDSGSTGILSSMAYKIQTSPNTTGNTGRTLSTGGVIQQAGIMIFYEYQSPKSQIIN